MAIDLISYIKSRPIIQYYIKKMNNFKTHGLAFVHVVKNIFFGNKKMQVHTYVLFNIYSKFFFYMLLNFVGT